MNPLAYYLRNKKVKSWHIRIDKIDYKVIVLLVGWNKNFKKKKRKRLTAFFN